MRTKARYVFALWPKMPGFAASIEQTPRQMYWSLDWLALDQRYLEAARSFLRRAGVQLKAAMLASDLRWAQQILGELVKIEQKQQEIEKRSLLQYLLNAGAGVLSKGQATIREAYPKAWVD